ncbi:hypothetical protein PUN28_014734 [Cardiocondyla obscurior]|uniref:Transmembrane protein n=1 Tax=Cardiocondyla obscurior TaxID=286306 RepID=A0AAW2EY99_9HYME
MPDADEKKCGFSRRTPRRPESAFLSFFFSVLYAFSFYRSGSPLHVFNFSPFESSFGRHKDEGDAVGDGRRLIFAKKHHYIHE